MSAHSIKQIGVFAKEAKPEPIYSCLCGALLYGEEELQEHVALFPTATMQQDTPESVTAKFERAETEDE